MRVICFTLRKAYSLKKYCILWYEIPLEQHAIYFFFFLFTLYYNTAFSCILFPFASFIQHIVVNNVKKKHKPEDNMVNIFRKIIRVQKNMRCIYLHEVQALKSATLLLFFFFLFILWTDPHLRAYTPNFVYEARHSKEK